MNKRPGKKIHNRRRRIGDLYSYISYNWQWGVVVLFLFSLSVYITYTSAVFAATPSTKILQVERIPLSSDNIETWAHAAVTLTEQRDQGAVNFPARSMPELIEWGRHNTPILDEAIPETDVALFLGVTASIHNARVNFRKLAEYELRLDESYGIIEEMEDLTGRVHFAMPDPPQLKGWEKVDLEVYISNDFLVENELYKLLPDLLPLVPAWEEPAVSEDKEMQEGDGNISRAKRIAWRTVSRSRSGPKVKRVR